VQKTAAKWIGENVALNPVAERRNGPCSGTDQKRSKVITPPLLSSNCDRTPERRAWLRELPALLEDLEKRWSLQAGPPFEDATCSWVAPALRSDGIPAVLKVGMPHWEGRDEIEGLRFWKGCAAVRLFEAEVQHGAMLLERCLPGTALRSEPEPTQDVIITSLLKRLWEAQAPAGGLGRFRHLSALVESWCSETLAQRASWPDPSLVEEGIHVMRQLALPGPKDTLLLTDLHAGNVLKSDREPWLVIDPKPFVGDRAYDLTQHLINCKTRLHADPAGLVRRVADLAEMDAERVRLWMWARAAADPRGDWKETRWMEIARRLTH
jgi:streptomycin 6-kinase